jgi:alpha-mannosidase
MTGKDEGTLALTLLRSVRCITGDYATEDTMAQEWVTNEGVCLGEYNYHMAIYPYEGNYESAMVAARAQQFMGMPHTAVQCVDRNKFIGGRPFVQGPGMPDLFYRPLERAEIVLPLDFKLFRLTEESVPGAMILAACKGAEAQDGSHIIRLYNSTSKTVDFKLAFGRAVRLVQEVNLAEEPVAALKSTRGTVALTAAPKQILTLRVVF